MLFSYQQALDSGQLNTSTKAFVKAALKAKSPQGLVLGPQALDEYVQNLVGVQELIDSVTDSESAKRVDYELKRRFLTGRVPESVSAALVEVQELLGLDETLQVKSIPLVAVLSADGLSRTHVIINIVGKKSLADAIRSLYARLYVHPHPQETPNASIIFYQMPNVHATIKATAHNDEISLQAVHGWGLFVGTDEIADTFTTTRAGAITQKEINTQDSMVYRNPRTKEVVMTAPRDASSQKVTDDEIRAASLLLTRNDLLQATFGVTQEKVLLLSSQTKKEQTVTSADESIPENSESQEPAYQQESEDDTSQKQENPSHTQTQDNEQPEVLIVDLEESQEQQEDIDEQSESTQEHQSKPAIVQEEEQPTPRQEEKPVESAQQTGRQESETDLYNAAQQSAGQALEYAYKHICVLLAQSIDISADTPFDSLIQQVSARRQVPFKNRIRTLHEMKRQDKFSRPSAEAVRFGLETLERFKAEFE